MSQPDVLPPGGSGLNPEERGRLALGKMYQYVFAHPKAMSNVLLLGLCLLIPVIGPIVAMGYVAELWVALHRRPQNLYPAFDFNRFSAYLSRGLWPFLVRLISGALVGAVVAPIYICSGVMTGAAAQADGGGEAVGIVVTLVSLVVLLVIMVIATASSVLIVPLELRAGLTEDLGKTFDFGWVKDFVGRTWKELLLMLVFLMFSSSVVVLIGMLLCCIGIYPATALVLMAMGHGIYQVYEIYLDRGGVPIPIKTEPPTV